MTRQHGVKKPIIFDSQGSNKIEREISLRLTAIRETFEELGILLCSQPSSEASTTPFSDYFHDKELDIPFWQKKIHNSNENLMNFCEKFNLVPNIHGLYEWTVLLSMIFQQNFRRYWTANFIVMLDSIPECYPEDFEVDKFMVSRFKGCIHSL